MAVVSSTGSIRVAELLGSLSLAGDLGMGQPMGHLLRTCVIAMRVSEQLNLAPAAQSDVYFTSLLAHTGCTAGIPQFTAFIASDELVALRDMCLCDPSSARDLLGWVRRNVSPKTSFPDRTQRVFQCLLHGEKVFGEFERGCSEVGARIAARLRMSPAVQDALANICESWNGKGPNKLRGEQVPQPARIVNAAMIIEVFFDAYGREAGIEAATRRRGKSFDPDVVDAFLQVVSRPAFWDELERDNAWETALGFEPTSQPAYAGEEQFDDIALALADFVDLKSVTTAAHSRRTAELAEALARRLGMPAADVALVRRAALVHDVGLVAVPSAVLDKTGPLSEAEREQFRLHPLMTERILNRVAALRPIAAIAALHHERLDGTGYPFGRLAPDVPLPARVVAVADAWQELLEGRHGRPGLEPSAALESLAGEVGSGIDRGCYDALTHELGAAPARRPARRPWPAGLSEREVEVLGLLCRGKTNREIAADLFISEKTIAHHLEHIYNKTAVASRAGAMLWAIENGLAA